MHDASFVKSQTLLRNQNVWFTVQVCKTENTEVDHLRQTGERVVKMQIIWIQRAMLCFFFPLVDEGQNGEQKMRDEGRREKAMRG